jgi:polyhydroxyalkanoate synthesis regulator phasin
MEDKKEFLEEIRALLQEMLQPVREECRQLSNKMSLMIIQQTGLGANLSELRPMVFEIVKDQTKIIEEMRDMIKDQTSLIRELTEMISALTERIAILESAAGLDQDLL